MLQDGCVRGREVPLITAAVIRHYSIQIAARDEHEGVRDTLTVHTKGSNVLSVQEDSDAWKRVQLNIWVVRDVGVVPENIIPNEWLG